MNPWLTMALVSMTGGALGVYLWTRTGSLLLAMVGAGLWGYICARLQALP